MPRSPLRRRTATVLAALYAFALGGCAVLTKSQVEAVKEFGATTQNYGALPGSVINSYADVVTTSRLIDIAAPTYGPRQTMPVVDANGNTVKVPTAQFELGEMKKARDDRQTYAKKAAVADSALVVLDRYAKALLRLSSDEFTDTLDASAVELGKSLDDSIKTYNNLAGRDLSPIGAAVAQVVSGVGRLWIRHRQTVGLQTYVELADPIVVELTGAIQSFVKDPIQRQIDVLTGEFDLQFQTIANRSGRIDVATARAFSDLYDRADETRALAASVEQSAIQYRAAHAALLKATRQKEDLKGQIEEIETLNQEIQAARKLKSKFD